MLQSIKIKLTKIGAKAPERSNPTDAGADLFCPEEAIILPKGSAFIDLGVQLEIPVGYAGFIYARSGLGSNGLYPRNCVGVIDSKYRGNIGIQLKNDTNEYWYLFAGNKIAQIVIAPVETPTFVIVDELDMEDDRGGGFGHTGN